jgi:hypothetical protein
MCIKTRLALALSASALVLSAAALLVATHVVH